MTAEIAVRRPELPTAADMNAASQYAARLADSGLLPKQYFKQPANVLWAVEYGRMIGLAPMAAITGVHVIEGKPSASAALISALVRRAGHKLRVRGDARSATCQIVRSDDPDFVFEVTYTIEEARGAKLTNKEVWQKYPASMLKARAVTQCARDACEEALLGMHYTPEELGVEVDADGEPVAAQQQVERSRPQQAAEDEWTQPAPVEQIDDAEVVPDGPRRSVQGQHIAISQLFKAKHGVTTRERKLAGVAHYLHHPVDSTAELTYDDAAELIDTLSKLPDYRPRPPEPEAEPAPVPLSIRQSESPEAIAEAQALLPLLEADEADRVESSLRDLLESAGSPEELRAAWPTVEARQSEGRIGAVHVSALRQVYELRVRSLAAEYERAVAARQPQEAGAR